jgi:hypothetical protein
MIVVAGSLFCPEAGTRDGPRPQQLPWLVRALRRLAVQDAGRDVMLLADEEQTAAVDEVQWFPAANL